MTDRLILHVDINSFYAQVELLGHPELQNSPVVVGGDAKKRRGVVLAKNEIAKRYNIITGESLFEANRKCPSLIVLPPHHDVYAQYSKKAMEIYLGLTLHAESFGPDESWLDLTEHIKENEHWLTAGLRMANVVRDEIYKQLSLTVSIGVSWNKSYAKLGSDYKKPDAITVISRTNFKDIVWPLNVGRLLYVGPVSQKRLGEAGIQTIGQLAAAENTFLSSLLGKSGPLLGQMARGEDDAKVLSLDEQKPRQSVGVSRTFAKDVKNLEEAKLPMRLIAEEVNRRLKEKGLRGQTVHIFIRDMNFQDKTRQRMLKKHILSTEELYSEAMWLLEAHEDFRLPLRALGISVSSLIHEGESWQPSLFDWMEERSARDKRAPEIEEALKKIQEKYGASSVDFGNVLFHHEDEGTGNSSSHEEDEDLLF